MLPTTRHHPPSSLARSLAAVALWLGTIVSLLGQSAGPMPIEALKQLSLDQLLNLNVTSVSRYPVRLLDAPAAIQLLTNDDIIRSGATSLPEALRMAPNLEVAQKNPHDWGISARGFNAALANKLLVLIDGRTVYTPLFSGVFWDVQDYLLADVDRIEVISGPGATLWGANAVNGVINVTTKSAKDTQGAYVEAGGGTELRGLAAARVGVAIGDNAYLRVYGKTFDRDSAVNAAGTDLNDAFTMHRGGFRFDADLPEDSAVTVSGDLYRGSEYIVTGGIQRVDGGNLLGRWSRSWSPDTDMHLQAYYDRTHLSDPITNQFGSLQYLTDDLDTYDLDFQHRFLLLDRQKIVWGLGYRLSHDAVKNATNTAFLPPSVDHQLFSAFAQDEIALSENVSLTAGTKIEHNDYTGREWEPSARLTWRMASTQTLWAAISRAVRMPSRYDRDIFLPRPPPLIASGDKQFQSETLIAYEAGYRTQLSSNLGATASLFYNRYDRLRSFGPASGTTLPIVFGNNLNAYTYGAELAGQYSIRPDWRLRAGYDLLLEHLSLDPGTVDIYGGRNETSDPKHQAMLGSSWDLPHAISLDANFRWVDRLPTTNGYVPSYLELNTRVAWRPNDRWELSVVGQNLLHDHHPEFGITIPRREEIQRSVFAEISARF